MHPGPPDTPAADLGHAALYRAFRARDGRFDGRVYVGVLSTGIYCRPICPARTPKPEHCTFHASAAAAHAAGFRPCLRCRPEVAPGLAGWRGTAASVSRALALIAEGALDGEGSVEALAARLGLGGRHLRRLFAAHVGATPLAVGAARRILFARQLIAETRLPLAEVAHAAGFGSVRRFNAVMRRAFDRPPGALRRPTEGRAPAADEGVALRLPFVPPLDWPALLHVLAARAVPGMEAVEGGIYRRVVRLEDGGALGTVELWSPGPRAGHLVARLRLPEVTALAPAVVRLRRLCDLEAEPEAIAATLGRDPLLAPLVAARPGLRVPGAWDSFELAVRAILGQRASVARAATLAGRLAARYGPALPAAARLPGLANGFPRPVDLAGTELRAIGLPRRRAAAISALAAAAAADPTLLDPPAGVGLEAVVARLAALPGIGAGTAGYIAMRALREPDAFAPGDLGILRAAAGPDGAPPTPAALLARAEAWRPWRAYAAMHLWAAGAAMAEAA